MQTREDTVNAIRQLLQDLEQHENSWENSTLPRHLEAMGAWLEACGNEYNPMPSWEFIIEMLSAARIYE